MSEKRFVKYVNDTLKDTKTNKMYPYMGNMVNLLNDQQDKITELQEKSSKLERQLRKAMVYLVSDTCSLSEAKLREFIDEIKNA